MAWILDNKIIDIIFFDESPRPFLDGSQLIFNFVVSKRNKKFCIPSNMMERIKTNPAMKGKEQLLKRIEATFDPYGYDDNLNDAYEGVDFVTALANMCLVKSKSEKFVNVTTNDKVQFNSATKKELPKFQLSKIPANIKVMDVNETEELIKTIDNEFVSSYNSVVENLFGDG